MSTDVKDALTGVVTECLHDLEQREPETWSPEADLAAETCLVLPVSDLGGAPLLASAHAAHERLVTALKHAAALDPLSPGQLPTPELAFYAMVVGDRAEDRAVFLRRANPRRGLRRGRVFTTLRDALTRVEDPIFAFDELVDLVVVGDSMIVLSQTAFSALFRGNEALTSQVPRWVHDIAQHLPISSDGEERLQSRSLRDSRLRTRLESITRRGHLAAVTPEVLRSVMGNFGLEPEKLLDDKGRLILDDEDIPVVLQFLNEDLFVGALSDVGFRADRKSPR